MYMHIHIHIYIHTQKYYDSVEVNQSIEATIQLVRDHYVVVSLPERVGGVIGCAAVGGGYNAIPRSVRNDVLGGFKVGMKCTGRVEKVGVCVCVVCVGVSVVCVCVCVGVCVCTTQSRVASVMTSWGDLRLSVCLCVCVCVCV